MVAAKDLLVLATSPVPGAHSKRVSQEDLNDSKSEGSSLGILDSDEPTEEERRIERALVWRLDLIFLLYGFVGAYEAVFKQLDQTNISNAYVSGMKEDLVLNGNQLNYFTTYFNIGYIVMLYPSIVIMSWVGPQYWLPTLELVWGVLTCCLSTVKTYQQVYIIRAFIGLAEGSAWPGYFTLLSLWYTPKEIAKRGAIYGSAGYAASMFSGAMQGALYTTLNGKHGRAGWRWLFLVNGVLTLFVALAGYFCFPGFPDRPNKLARFWLTDKYVAAANRRLKRIRRQQVKPITLRRFGRVFLRWELYIFGLLCWIAAVMNYGNGYFNLYLKSLKVNGKSRYTTPQLNYIPIAGSALAAIWTILICIVSDRTGWRVPLLQLNALVVIFGSAVIGSKPTNIAFNYVGFFALYVGQGGLYIFWSWISDVCAYSADLRTVIYATGTTASYILSATVPLHAWQASLAPHWKIGPWISVATFSFGILVAWPLGAYLHHKQAIKQQGWLEHPETIPPTTGYWPVQGKEDDYLEKKKEEEYI